MKKRKINRKSFFVKNYSQSWNFIKESKNFIYTIVLIFFITSLFGFFLPLPEQVTENILKLIQELLEKTKGMSQLELIAFIFLNNIQSSFFGIIFGILLGIFPIIAAIANGFVLGFVASLSVSSEGFFVLWRILPHGLFELPAIFISFGLGLKIGTFIFQEKKFESFKNYLHNALRVFLFIIIPLLITAAIIEGTLVFFLVKLILYTLIS